MRAVCSPRAETHHRAAWQSAVLEAALLDSVDDHDEYHEAATMEGYDEAAYLLGDRHTPAPNDRGGAQ